MPNFYTGCNVIESLLQSTLECFYNQQCIDGLKGQISSSSSVSVTALNVSLPSVYFMNSTIRELLHNLMIEQWNVSPIFENYYNACHPIKCTYTLVTNNNLIYIFTTLFGIAGGLITALKFIVPKLVKLMRKKREQQQAVTGKIKSKMISFTVFDLLVVHECSSKIVAVVRNWEEWFIINIALFWLQRRDTGNNGWYRSRSCIFEISPRFSILNMSWIFEWSIEL